MQMNPRMRSLAWGALVLVALGTTPNVEGQTKALKTTGGATVFVTVADLHVTDAASLAGFKQVIPLINDVIKPAFLYVAGDTPDGGTLEQYQAYKAVRDTVKCPVFDVVGDHEAKSGGLEHYRKILGEPTWAFTLGRYRCVGLNSMGLDAAQLAWAQKELSTAKTDNQIPLAFIHHNLAGIKDQAAVAELNKTLDAVGTRLVLAGHTHTNSVINSGRRLDITTTSLKAPRGKDPAGFALVTLDEGRIAWHAIPLGRLPIVAISSPIDKLLAVGPEAVVKGQTTLRVKAYDPQGIKSVSATLAGATPLELKSGPQNTWTANFDSTKLPDGPQTLKVTAVNNAGQSASEEIVLLVSQAGTFTPTPATVSDGGPGGKGPKQPGPGPKDGPGGKPKKEPMTLDQLPAPVQAALKKQAGDAPLAKLEKDPKPDQVSYHAEWQQDNLKHDVRLAPDGTLLETRQQIPSAQLPETIAKVAHQTLPDLSAADCMKITRYEVGQAHERYEVNADLQGEKKHLVISPDGAVEIKGPGGPKKPKPEAGPPHRW